ncbi:hypothetical protein LX36DRAFT_301817 [Colletotrichum falcatum]|nr:hypothetical protein LX36DRAFT_301817 [Colletotrichum falcatum]
MVLCLYSWAARLVLCLRRASAGNDFYPNVSGLRSGIQQVLCVIRYSAPCGAHHANMGRRSNVSPKSIDLDAGNNLAMHFKTK